MNFKSTPKFSFVLALFSTLLYLVFQSFEDASLFLYTATWINSLLFLGLSFLIFWLLLNLFVFSRIKKITSIVTKYHDPSSITEDDSNDPIENLSEEIHSWAAERKREIEQLKKLEMYRKEFLGNVSHELKTPIFNIQGYISTLLEGGLKDETINVDYLTRAEKSVERMITIVEDLESISQLETGTLELELEDFDVVMLAKDVLHAQEYRATTKGIILTLEYYENRPILVHADKFRIRQVLTNLIVNSIKYGKEYGETQVKFIDSKNKILVEVTDNGIGIAKEHIPRLFERFFRVDKSRSREEGGTGLGLSIVKHIIEAHGQTINVISTSELGTTFSFTLDKAKEA